VSHVEGCTLKQLKPLLLNSFDLYLLSHSLTIAVPRSRRNPFNSAPLHCALASTPPPEARVGDPGGSQPRPAYRAIFIRR
jgi:hypothetical protein